MVLLPLLALGSFGYVKGLTFCCSADNDLFMACRVVNRNLARFTTPEEAIRQALPGSTLAILGGSAVDQDLRKEAERKGIKLYIELSANRKDGTFSRQIEWERVVVSSDRFGRDLPLGRILSIGRPALPLMIAKAPLLVAGRVAGFDSLAFGMPKETYPVLWEDDRSTLVAAAPLSMFSKGRFAPAKAWRPVFRFILRWLGEPELADQLPWRPSVRPAYGLDQRVPRDVEAQAAKRAARWFEHCRLLVSSASLITYGIADKYQDRVGPMPDTNGDGSLGILEGYSSAIAPDGSQPVRYYRRADCNAESAMALALAGDARQREIGNRIADFIVNRSLVQHVDPSKESFGLVGWNDQPVNQGTFYGDDNARYLLGLIGAAGALKSNDWDDAILRCILANFRTTGQEGFRGDSLDESEIQKSGWRNIHHRPIINMAPHFEAYMWALYLWAYQRTGYRPLLELSRHAIERTMDSGENAWTWTNGIQQERSRMLLALSWLVRVDDTPKHRQWLREMAQRVLSHQDQTGAIREEVGQPGHGIAGPPTSNEAFGTAETPLIQENGDPLADLLYTSNFAFLGLHEAAATLHDKSISTGESRLAGFLARIQIRSDSHPELDGAWFRAFDFGDWDYWASNADLGWGAWSIETGWSVAWITSVLSLRERNQSFWDLHPTFKVNRRLLDSMLKE